MHLTETFVIRDRRSTQLPLTLRRSCIRIRPTRYGLIFILLLLAMFVGAFNYNNNLGFLLAFLLGSMAFVSIGPTYKNMAGLTIGACNTKPVFAGGQAVFELSVNGAGANRVGIGFALSKAETVCDIVSNQDNRIDVYTDASNRGILRPGPLLVYSDYPLGLFIARSQLHLNLECVVYPRPLAGGVNPTGQRFSIDRQGDVSGPGVDDFQGLKGYMPGDALQRISWKASSRGQGLFTKDFDRQYGSSVYLNWHSLQEPDTERKLSLLCHMILDAHQHNFTYGLKLPGHTIDPDKGEIHKNRCLKALALFSV